MDFSGQEWPRYGHQWTIVDRNSLNMDDCGQEWEKRTGMASIWTLMDNSGQEWPQYG